MIVCLKDVVIHIICLDPFTGLHVTCREVRSRFTFHVIVLYCFVSMS